MFCFLRCSCCGYQFCICKYCWCPFCSWQQIWVDVVLYAHVGFELVLPFFECWIVSIICWWLQLQLVCWGKCFCCFFISCHRRSYVVSCCHFFLLRVPHTLELGSSPLAFLHAQFVVELVSSPLLLYSWSVLCWAATQVLLVVVCLELTWMLPGSLLRYHEKIHGSLLSLLFQCAPFCLLGSDLLSLQAGSRPVEPECHVGMTKCTIA